MASINQVIKGLQILSKYHDADDINGICAEHDTIYAGHGGAGGEGAEKDRMVPADLLLLGDLGWSYRDDSWQVYV